MAVWEFGRQDSKGEVKKIKKKTTTTTNNKTLGCYTEKPCLENQIKTKTNNQIKRRRKKPNQNKTKMNTTLSESRRNWSPRGKTYVLHGT